jgi:hypothetical protein
MQSLLELKTQPKFLPDNCSLSMTKAFGTISKCCEYIPWKHSSFQIRGRRAGTLSGDVGPRRQRHGLERHALLIRNFLHLRSLSSPLTPFSIVHTMSIVSTDPLLFQNCLWMVAHLWAERHLADRHLADRHFTDRHLFDIYLADRYLSNRHLALRTFSQQTFGWQTFVRQIFGWQIFGWQIFVRQIFGWQTFGQQTFGQQTQIS